MSRRGISVGLLCFGFLSCAALAQSNIGELLDADGKSLTKDGGFRAAARPTPPQVTRS